MEQQRVRPRRPSVSRVDLGTLIVLRQPRKSFDGIEELAEDIYLKGGMLMLPIVASFGEQRFVEYLETVNHVYGTEYAIVDHHTNRASDGRFQVLLAGERRTRAYRLLIEEGRAESWYWADVRRSIEPRAALEIQLAENTHRQVPPHEEADAIDRLFRYERTCHGTTLTLFAKRIGRSSSWVRNALRYIELPEQVQVLVRQGYLPYGGAVQIARLRRVQSDDETLLNWATSCLAARLSVAELRARVDRYLLEKEEGQTSLLSLFEGERDHIGARLARRKTVEGHVVRIHWQNEAYLRLVLDLLERGLLLREDSPYASGSPRRLARSQLGTLIAVAQHLVRGARGVTEELRELVALLDRLEQTEGLL